MLDIIQSIYESEDFSDSRLHHIFEHGQCKEFKKS